MIHRLALTRLLVLVVGLTTLPLHAQSLLPPPPAQWTAPVPRMASPAPNPLTTSQVEQLYRKLEAQERRIRQLEVQRLPAPDSATVAPAGNRWRNDDANGGGNGGEADSALLERLDTLQERWDKYDADQDKKKKDAASKPSIKIVGRIHADYWAFPDASPGIGFFEHPDPMEANFGTDPEDRFLFRRNRIGFQGTLFDTMLYKLEVDFNNPGRPEYKDMYLGWTELPYNQTVLLGNQKRPLGLDHLNSSRYNVFMERPLVVEAFNEDARRIGLAAYGYTDDELYHWRYGVYNLENTSTDGRYIGDTLQLSANARLSSSPWYDETSGGRGYWHWGIAGMLADPDGNAGDADTNNNEGRFRTRPEARSDMRWINTGRIAGIDTYEILGLESMLNVGPLQITSEYQCNWSQRDALPDVFFHGAYVYVSYFLTGEHQPYSRQRGTIGRVKPFENFFLVDTCDGERATGWGAWQVALRYSYLDLSDADVLGGLEHNVTLGLNWFWTSHSKVQLNYIYGDIRDHEPVGGFTSGYFQIVGARFMVDF